MDLSYPNSNFLPVDGLSESNGSEVEGERRRVQGLRERAKTVFVELFIFR